MAFADLIVGKWNRNLFPWFTPGSRLSGCISFVSYIKPQRFKVNKRKNGRCISFVSYIKPQLISRYLSARNSCISFVSYIKPQLSNTIFPVCAVVYLSFPTSNHNTSCVLSYSATLYIFRFLHQTTTCQGEFHYRNRCISFVSYIKPQQDGRIIEHKSSCISFVSYIKPQPVPHKSI